MNILPNYILCKYFLLRPIAGAINFCPNQFVIRSDEENIRIGIHEVVHALVRILDFPLFFLIVEENLLQQLAGIMLCIVKQLNYTLLRCALKDPHMHYSKQ